MSANKTPEQINRRKFLKVAGAASAAAGSIGIGLWSVESGKDPINISKCHNFWYSNLGNVGCRLCLTSCPYSRKSNWLHRGALKVSANDPTGLSHGIMTDLQQRFYPVPDVEEYFMPSMGGSNASYRKPPRWLKADEYIDFSGGVK